MKTIDAGRSDARSSAWCRSSGAAVLAERYTHVKVMNFRSAPADGTIFLRARRGPSNISSTTPDRESHNDHLYHEQQCPSTRNRRLTVHQPRNRSGRGRISGVRKLSNKVQNCWHPHDSLLWSRCSHEFYKAKVMRIQHSQHTWPFGSDFHLRRFE